MGPQRTEGVKIPRDEGIGSCEPPSISAGNQMPILWAASVLKHGMSPQPSSRRVLKAASAWVGYARQILKNKRSVINGSENQDNLSSPEGPLGESDRHMHSSDPNHVA